MQRENGIRQLMPFFFAKREVWINNMNGGF